MQGDQGRPDAAEKRISVRGFAVLYDASVIHPAPHHDLLMHLALTVLYRKAE